jgi:hypothetical protein
MACANGSLRVYRAETLSLKSEKLSLLTPNISDRELILWNLQGRDERIRNQHMYQIMTVVNELCN